MNPLDFRKIFPPIFFIIILSSLLITACNKKEVAKVSVSPGKTQLINHFDILSNDKNKWWLVDLPGYGYAKRSVSMRKSWQKMIQDYIRKRENLINLFVLIDSRHEPQKIDLEFVNQLGEWRIPFALVFTKADKSTVKEAANNVNDFLREMLKSWEAAPPHFLTSAIKRTGAKQLTAFISGLNSEYYLHKKISSNIFCFILQPELELNMKRTLVEKGAVATMFVLVLIVFSFAERDTQKLIQQHSKTAQKFNTKPNLSASATEQKLVPLRVAKN